MRGRRVLGRGAALVWLLAGTLACAGSLATLGSLQRALGFGTLPGSPLAHAARWCAAPTDWLQTDPTDDDLSPGAAKPQLATLATWMLAASSGLPRVRARHRRQGMPAAWSLFAQQTMLLR